MLWNSGWNCTAMKKGCPGISMTSPRVPSGEVPLRAALAAVALNLAVQPAHFFAITLKSLVFGEEKSASPTEQSAVSRAGGAMRLLRNGALWLLNSGLSPLLVVPLTAWAASVSLDWRPPWWSGWGGLLLDLLLLDFLIYWWHRANHELPFLWRFHEVHHRDEFLDATSAVRFHFGEILLSALARAADVFPIPDSLGPDRLGWAEMAGFPVTYGTAHAALRWHDFALRIVRNEAGEVGFQVFAGLAPLPGAAPAGATEVGAEDGGEDIEDVAAQRDALIHAAEAVVARALLGVGQHRVRFVDGLELLLGLVVATVAVRMVRERQLAVSGLDGLIVGGAFHLEDGVIIRHAAASITEPSALAGCA